jgi:hypothetical protein
MPQVWRVTEPTDAERETALIIVENFEGNFLKVRDEIAAALAEARAEAHAAGVIEGEAKSRAIDHDLLSGCEARIDPDSDHAFAERLHNVLVGCEGAACAEYGATIERVRAEGVIEGEQRERWACWKEAALANNDPIFRMPGSLVENTKEYIAERIRDRGPMLPPKEGQ